MSKEEKKVNFFVRASRSTVKWLRELRSELKKISWPSREQLINNTLVTLATVAVVGIFVSLFSFAGSQIVAFIIQLAA